jgi:hypothetical protein
VYAHAKAPPHAEISRRSRRQRFAFGSGFVGGESVFSGGDLEAYGFETTPDIDIDANSPAVATPELSTWAMMALGFVGTALLAKRRRSLRLA